MVTIYVLDVVSVICMRVRRNTINYSIKSLVTDARWQMSEHILPYCSSIVELLGKLWQQTKEHAMLKCSVLQCLSTLLQVRWSTHVTDAHQTNKPLTRIALLYRASAHPESRKSVTRACKSLPSAPIQREIATCTTSPMVSSYGYLS